MLYIMLYNALGTQGWLQLWFIFVLTYGLFFARGRKWFFSPSRRSRGTRLSFLLMFLSMTTTTEFISYSHIFLHAQIPVYINHIKVTKACCTLLTEKTHSRVCNASNPVIVSILGSDSTAKWAICYDLVEQISYECEKSRHMARHLLNQSYSARALLIQSEC
jgi:hypothetical protein